jgi:hypothetical protein
MSLARRSKTRRIRSHQRRAGSNAGRLTTGLDATQRLESRRHRLCAADAVHVIASRFLPVAARRKRRSGGAADLGARPVSALTNIAMPSKRPLTGPGPGSAAREASASALPEREALLRAGRGRSPGVENRPMQELEPPTPILPPLPSGPGLGGHGDDRLPAHGWSGMQRARLRRLSTPAITTPYSGAMI